MTATTNIMTMPFTPAATEAAIAAGRAFLIDVQQQLSSKQRGPSVGMFSCIKPNGTRHDQMNGACHASINTGFGLPNIDLVATISHGHYPYAASHDYKGLSLADDPEVRTAFYDWLINRSFASRFLVPTDVDFARDFGIMIHTDIPAALLQAICIVSRHPFEKGQQLRRWYKWVQAGLDEDLAFACAMTTTPGATDVSFYSVGSHTIFTDVNLFGRWMPRTFVLKPGVYRTSHNFNGVNAMTASGLSANWVSDIKNSLGTKAKVGVVIPDPFAPPAPPSSITESDMIEHGIPFLMAKLKETAS